MKHLWISAAIIAALAAGALANVWYLGQFVDGLALTLEQAQQSAEAGDTERAIRLTQRAQGQFDEKAPYLHITLSHQDIDNIEISFGEVLEYLRFQEQGGEYTAANARLLTQLYLLAEAEQLTLKNLL